MAKELKMDYKVEVEGDGGLDPIPDLSVISFLLCANSH